MACNQLGVYMDAKWVISRPKRLQRAARRRSQEHADLGLTGSLLAAALVGTVLYVGDRGIAFNVCAYFAIASRGEFTGEQAFRETDNPFLRITKLAPAFALIVITFVIAHQGGIRANWQIAMIVAVALWYAAVVTFSALRAFRRTRFGTKIR